MTRFADVFRGRIFRFVAACLSTYIVVALVTPAPMLILAMNDLLMSIAGGVCVSYGLTLWPGMKSAEPKNGEILGVGIFFFAAGALLLRVASLVGRDLGYPQIYNSDFITAALASCMIGGMLHLWAPLAIKGRIPPRRWTSTGIVVAVGLFLVLISWSLHMSAAHPSIRLG